jgi:hypothetical protein
MIALKRWAKLRLVAGSTFDPNTPTSRVAPTTAWLYTNGNNQTVRLSVHDVGSSLELMMAGPGHARETRAFPDALSLIRYQSKVEAGLVECGFALEDFVTDRRSGVDRRGANLGRLHPDRRQP